MKTHYLGSKLAKISKCGRRVSSGLPMTYYLTDVTCAKCNKLLTTSNRTQKDQIYLWVVDGVSYGMITKEQAYDLITSGKVSL
jgi:hypothetical protein